MSTYTIGYDKKYKCSFCEILYNDVNELIESSWRCPKCDNYIHIASPDMGTGYTMIRKRVKELRKLDSVHMLGGSECYDVIALEKKDSQKIAVALRKFGKIVFNENDYVSVIDGGYYEDTWKEK